MYRYGRSAGAWMRFLSASLIPWILLLYLRCFCVAVSANDREAEVMQVMREGFYSFEESIDIGAYGVLPQELSRLFAWVIKDDPYLFFVKGNLTYSYQPEGAVLSVRPLYTMIPSNVGVAWAYCRRRVRTVASLAEGTDAERALFLHDYICENFAYDDSLKNDNLYDFLLSGKGTCQAYTLLYTALLRESGIDVCFVASDTIAHIWNLVRIDGEWYHVDVTWDDSAEGYGHRHFLLSDRQAVERGHKDWYSAAGIVCDSEFFADRVGLEYRHGEFSLGDADHSGEVLLLDLLLVKRALRQGDEEICSDCGDLDRSGTLNEEDVRLFREKLLWGN